MSEYIPSVLNRVRKKAGWHKWPTQRKHIDVGRPRGDRGEKSTRFQSSNKYDVWARRWAGKWIHVAQTGGRAEAWEVALAFPLVCVDLLVLPKRCGNPNVNTGERGLRLCATSI
jgi:hypothetical protein